MPTALCLYSGGLDSRLVIKIMRDCGWEVAAFHAQHAFIGKEKPAAARARVERECRELGARAVYFSDTTPRLVELLRHNRYGFGKNLNPCIDCRLATITAAAAFMAEAGAELLATGEVLGQRPKSQQRNGLNAVSNSLPPELRGRLLRPLSAKLLPPTLAEQEGKIDREKLYDFSGRGRQPQMALAEKFGITDYPNPAGGCLLTDAGFCGRMRALLEKQPEVSAEDIELRKVGRQAYTASGTLMVISRDSAEGDRLEQLMRPGDITYITVPHNGALVLLRGNNITKDDERLAASAAAHYSKYRGATRAEFCRVKDGAGEMRELAVDAYTAIG